MLPIKWLSLTKMATRREQSLCFNCDSRFVPSYKCKPAQFLWLMVDMYDEESLELPNTILEHTTIEPVALIEDASNFTPCISFQ